MMNHLILKNYIKITRDEDYTSLEKWNEKFCSERTKQSAKILAERRFTLEEIAKIKPSIYQHWKIEEVKDLP